jgi:hypothetical protein
MTHNQHGTTNTFSKTLIAITAVMLLTGMAAAQALTLNDNLDATGQTAKADTFQNPKGVLTLSTNSGSNNIALDADGDIDAKSNTITDASRVENTGGVLTLATTSGSNNIALDANGDIDAKSNAITNVGNVDGVDVDNPGTGIEVNSNQLRLSSPGNGLTGGAGSALAVQAADNTLAVSGSGVEVTKGNGLEKANSALEVAWGDAANLDSSGNINDFSQANELDSSGNIDPKVNTGVSSDISTNGEEYIYVSDTSSLNTITLSDSDQNAGYEVTVVDASNKAGDSNGIDITPQSGTLYDGGSTGDVSISSNGGTATFTSDGTNWYRTQ